MFGGEFLDAIFSEEALAGSVGFKDGLGGLHFADGHEGDLRSRAMGAGACVGDAVVDLPEIGSDQRHGRASVYESWGKILRGMDFWERPVDRAGSESRRHNGYCVRLHPDGEILRPRVGRAVWIAWGRELRNRTTGERASQPTKN